MSSAAPKRAWPDWPLILGAVLALCIAVGVALFAVFYKSNREKALAKAKRYGEVHAFDIKADSASVKFLRVALGNREGVDQVLPELKHVPDLTELSIWGAPLTLDDLGLISELTQIHTLSLQSCDIEDRDLTPLSTMVQLTELRLAFNPITDDGLHYLSQMNDLAALDLTRTTVTGVGLKSITSELKQLNLNSTRVDDSTIQNCLRFPRLQRLEFSRTKVTEAGLMKLVPLHWLTTLGTPNEISVDSLRRFHTTLMASLEAAAAAGQDVPPEGRTLAPY
jgi:hypothetical protein